MLHLFFSSKVPIKAPRIITIPILLNVLLNPVPITPGMSTKGIPATIANRSDTVIIDKNGCTFHLEIAKTISKIATINVINSGIPAIKCLLAFL